MAFDHSQLALDLHLCHSLSQSNGTVSGPGRSRTKKRESLPPIFTEPKGQEEFITPQPGDLESLICRQMQTHPLTCTIEHSDPCKHSHTKWSTKKRILFAHGIHPCKSTISTAKQTVCVFLSTSSQTL